MCGVGCEVMCSTKSKCWGSSTMRSWICVEWVCLFEMGELRFEWKGLMKKKGGSGALCFVLWSVGYEVKGVDGAGGYLNELIIERINSCWKGELKLPDNNSNEWSHQNYTFYTSIHVKMNTYAPLFASISISGESTDHHHNQFPLFTNDSLSSKQCVQEERWISALTSIRQSTIQSALSITTLFIWHPFLSILSTCNFGRSIVSIALQHSHFSFWIRYSRWYYHQPVQRTLHYKRTIQIPSQWGKEGLFVISRCIICLKSRLCSP